MILCTRQRLKFMTHFRLPPTRYSHVHLQNAVSASLFLLLTVSAGCSSDRETGTAPARNRSKQEPDAGMQCPAFNEDYRDEFKACTSDDDCELADVAFGCSTRHGVYGVAKAVRAEFDRCLPNPDELGSCSPKPPILRAEDGRVAADDLSDVRVRCVRGECRTRIEDRTCGATGTVCTCVQLCVSYQDAMGVTQFTCMDNLCGDRPLDCSCAGSICAAPGDAMRMCATVQIETSDVYCKVVLR